MIWEQKRKKHFRQNLDEDDEPPRERDREPPRDRDRRDEGMSKRDQVYEEKRRRRERGGNDDYERNEPAFEVRHREPEVEYRRQSPPRKSFDTGQNPFSQRVEAPAEPTMPPRNEVNSAGGLFGGMGKYDRERKQGHKDFFDPSIPKANEPAPRQSFQRHHSADQQNRGGMFDSLGKNEHPHQRRVREQTFATDPRKNDPIYNGGMTGGGGLLGGIGNNPQPGPRRGRHLDGSTEGIPQNVRLF